MRKIKWTKTACLEVAKDCSGRTDLQTKNEYVYNLMLKKGWLYEVFPEKIPRPNKYSDEEIAEVAKKYNTRNSFKWGDWNFYHMARRRNLLDIVCSHMKTSTHTDGNVLYVLSTETADGEVLFKVGITSKRCYKRRLVELKCHSKFIFNTVHWVEHPKARSLEKMLLKMGVKPKNLQKFKGSTEMRIFTKQELTCIEDLLKQAGGVLS